MYVLLKWMITKKPFWANLSSLKLIKYDENIIELELQGKA